MSRSQGLLWGTQAGAGSRPGGGREGGDWHGLFQRRTTPRCSWWAPCSTGISAASWPCRGGHRGHRSGGLWGARLEEGELGLQGAAPGRPDTAFRPAPRNTTVLNSKVISVTVKPPPRSVLTPLEIEFAHMYNVRALCVCVCASACVWPPPPDPRAWGMCAVTSGVSPRPCTRAAFIPERQVGRLRLRAARGHTAG